MGPGTLWTLSRSIADKLQLCGHLQSKWRSSLSAHLFRELWTEQAGHTEWSDSVVDRRLVPSCLRQLSNARFSPFRCRSSVAVSPFCRCKIPLFCKNYVRKFRSVRHKDTQRQRQRQRQRCTETATANGNGETATKERQRNGGNRA